MEDTNRRGLRGFRVKQDHQELATLPSVRQVELALHIDPHKLSKAAQAFPNASEVLVIFNRQAVERCQADSGARLLPYCARRCAKILRKAVQQFGHQLDSVVVDIKRGMVKSPRARLQWRQRGQEDDSFGPKYVELNFDYVPIVEK